MRTVRPRIDRSVHMWGWGEEVNYFSILGEVNDLSFLGGGGWSCPGGDILHPSPDQVTSPPRPGHVPPVTYPMMHLLLSPPKCDRMTDACENITFAMLAVIIVISGFSACLCLCEISLLNKGELKSLKFAY